MPKYQIKKTYLERIDPTPVMDVVRFLHSGKYSPLVRSMRYALLGMCGDIEAEVEARRCLKISEEVTDETLFSLEPTRKIIRYRLDKQEFSRRLLPYLHGYAKEGVPYAHYEEDPAPISQLKKTINAFYHTEEALKIAESFDIEGLSLKDNNSLDKILPQIEPFVEHVYQLCMLITHPDVDLVSAFGDDWRQINDIIFNLASKIGEKFPEHSEFLSQEYGVDIADPKSLAKQLGKWSGAVLENLRPTREIDYSTVSYFSADLSTYLNRLTHFIQDNANTLFKKPYLNQEAARVDQYEISEQRLHELDQASVKLEHAFTSLNSGWQPLQPLNAYALINIVKSTVTVVQGIIQESGNFRAETEELLRKALAELKYRLFLELIKFVDKLEEEALMDPGTLSGPLMNDLEQYYQAVFSYVSSFVDLSVKGPDLAKLGDSCFTEMRQQALYERQAIRETEFIAQEARKEKLDEFFTLLAVHQGKRLSELSLIEKQQLLERFKVVQPLIVEEDIALSNIIAENLLPTKPVDLKPDAPKPTEPKPAAAKPKTWLDTIAGGVKYVYEQASQVSKYFEDYADRVDLVTEGYTFALLPAYANFSSAGVQGFAKGALLSPKHIYVSVVDGKIALTIKQPNGAIFSNVVTPYDSVEPLVLATIKALEGELLAFARSQNFIKPSIHERIKQKIRKQEATIQFRAVLNQDSRKEIYHQLKALLQQLYPKQENAYRVVEKEVIGLVESASKDVNEPIQLKDTSFEDLLKLAQAYILSRDRLKDAEQGLNQFFALLESYQGSEAFSDASGKNQLRNLYTMIQPYLISSLREVKGETFASDYDRRVIDAFAGQKTKGKVLLFNEVLAVKNWVLDDFSVKKTDILSRKLEIDQAIHQQVNESSVEKLLVEDVDAARSSYLIKKPKYSKYMQVIEKKLTEVTTLFSKNMQDKLVIQTQPWDDQALSLFVQFETKPKPFPEAYTSEYLTYLKQERQVIAWKQLHNCVHHLREVAVQLEELNEHSYKLEYVWRVILIEEHLRKAIVLYYQLLQDEHIVAMSSDLMQSIGHAIKTFQTLGSAYAPDKADTASNIDTHDAVFFIVNGLLVAREQIESWQKGQYITKETADSAQVFSENVAAKVRNIVESNSYLQWVLQTDTFYTLFYDLKEKWNQFAVSSTDAIEQNLNTIYTENFCQILISADAQERRLGLEPGTLSRPLKEILDASYFGLIEVLSHDTGHHISLATTLQPFDKRRDALEVNIQKISHDLSEALQHLPQVTQLIASLTQYPQLVADLSSHSSQVPAEIVAQYQYLISVFNQIKSIPAVDSYVQENFEPDVLKVLLQLTEGEAVSLNASDAEMYQAHLLNLAKLCEARLQGDKNTAELSLIQCYEQRDYLRNQLEQQQANNNVLKRDIMKKLVFSRLVDHQSASKRLLFSGDLYDKALKEEIEVDLEAFLDGISENESIEQQVAVFLGEKVAAFDNAHFEDFKLFNELHRSISELKAYLDEQNRQLEATSSFYRHTWSFENAETISLKFKLYRNLERILAGKKPIKSKDGAIVVEQLEESEKTFDPNDKWHIKSRIACFKKEVDSPRFTKDLLSYQRYKISPLSWLVRWLVDLLKLIGIYKSEIELVHEHLKVGARGAKSKMNKPSSKEQSTSMMLDSLKENHRSKNTSSNQKISSEKTEVPSSGGVAQLGMFKPTEEKQPENLKQIKGSQLD